MSRRTDALNGYEVGLTSGISDVDTSFPVESTVGLIAPGYLVIDPDDPTKREYFKYTIINGSNLEMPNTGFRGLRGSASGASAHLAGARVRAVAVGQWLDDIFSDIEDLEAAQAAFLLLDGSRAMTGDLNMGGKQVQVLGEGVLNDDAVTKLYVDTEDTALRNDFTAADLLLLPLDGTRPMTGALDMGTNLISNVVDPVGPQDAATQVYVTAGDDLRLPLVGGQLTGDLIINSDDATARRLFLRDDGTTGMVLQNNAATAVDSYQVARQGSTGKFLITATDVALTTRNAIVIDPDGKVQFQETVHAFTTAGVNVLSYAALGQNDLQARNVLVLNPAPTTQGLNGDLAIVLENTANRGVWFKNGSSWLQIANR